MSVEQLYPQSQQQNPYPPAERTIRARPPGRSGGSILLIVALSLVLILTLAVGGGLIYLDRSFTGKIYPNVTVQGIAVGELTPQEAEAALRSRYGTFLQKPATISYGDQTWTPSLQELGMEFDFAGAATAAYRLGRGNGLFANAQEVAAIWQNGFDLPLQISYSEQVTQQYLSDLAASIDAPPVDATLTVNGAIVRTTPAQIGKQVLLNTALADLSTGLRTFTPTTIDLGVRDLQPRLGDAPVMGAASRLRRMLAEPVTMSVGTQSFVWHPSEISAMIQTARVPAGPVDEISVSINEHLVERALKKIADQTEIVGTRPRLAWDNGNLKITKPGDNGWRIDEPFAREAVLAAINGGPRALELPMSETLPPIHEGNLADLGITDLVSVGKSDFTGSADYRIHNIGVGMTILNGILIAPGEEFSFNDNIGNIDASQGFVEGAAIVQNRTQQEFGGGICQDSTTLFRAAFWAGLPITERWGHSFYINWYDKYALGPLGNGPGLDATIFTGGPDLKFMNDTGSWLLIQSWSNSKSGIAQIELYGAKLDRRVELTQRVYNQVPAPGAPVYVADPKQPAGRIRQSDRARGGMTIDVTRTVYIDGVANETELYRTRFRPWPNIYVVNPQDMGPDGRPALPDPNAPPADPNAPPVDPNAPPVDPNAPPAPPADQIVPITPPADPNVPPAPGTTTDG